MKTFAKRAAIYMSLLGLGVTMFSSLINLVPVSASAQINDPQTCQAQGMYWNTATNTCQDTPPAAPPQTGFWSLNVPEQAKVWTELAALGHCSKKTPAARSGTTGIDPTKPSTWFSGTVDVGMLVDPHDDGTLDCNDENSWISNLLGDAKIGANGTFSDFYNSTDGSPQGIQQALTKALFPAGKPATIPDQLRYYILFQAFINSQGSGCAAVATSSLTPDAKIQQGYTESANIWVAQGGQVSSVPYSYKNKTTDMTVGYDVNKTDPTHTSYECQTIANLLGSPDQGLQLASAFAANDTTDNPGQPGGGDASNADTGCDFNGDPFTWFVCPVIDSMEKMIQKVDNFITESMTFNTKNFFEDTPGYRTAWNSFRLLAIGVLIIAGLLMLGSQAIGVEMFDAYTIKKVLPRLLIAIIGISLSWPLIRYTIDFFNVVGLDIRDIIYSPFSTLQGSLSGGAMAVLTGGAVYGIWALGPLGVLSFLATAALAVLVGFIIIIVRYLALMVIIIFAPIAIAAYVLPNTQKLWSLWKDNFIGLLLVFPIISAFIAIGKVFSAVSLSGTAPAFGGTTIMQIVGLAAYFLPYFLLPIAFRMASGVIGTVAGFVNDRHKGAFDKLKGYRKGAYEKHGGVRMERARGRALQSRYRAYHALGHYADDEKTGKVGKFLARRARGAVGGFNIESEISAHNAHGLKQIQDQTSSGPDNLVRAYTVNKEAADREYATYADAVKQFNAGNMTEDDLTLARNRASQYVALGEEEFTRDANGKLNATTGRLEGYKTLGGKTASETDVLASQNAFGKNNHAAFQAALTYEMGKANTQEEQDGLINRYAEAAQRFNMTESEANEVWIGSAFAKQNENRQWKHYGWKADANGRINYGLKGDKLFQEIDEKQGAYQMMQQNADTWTTMSQEMKRAHNVVNGVLPGDRAQAEDILRRGARIAETISSSSLAGTQIAEPGKEADTAGQTISGRQVGAGAPGRVMQEMQRFHEIAKNTTAGTAYEYKPPKFGAGPDANPLGSQDERRQNGRNT